MSFNVLHELFRKVHEDHLIAQDALAGCVRRGGPMPPIYWLSIAAGLTIWQWRAPRRTKSLPGCSQRTWYADLRIKSVFLLAAPQG